MDVFGLGRFHGSVAELPSDGSVPPGGLHKFLREDLREKVFLVSLGVLEDRWATRCVPSLTREELFSLRECMRVVVEHVYYAARVRQNELRGLFSRFNVPAEATWMFYTVMVLLHAVGFEGDDGPLEHGFGPLGMALSQTEFMLRKCSERHLLHSSLKDKVSLEYPEYDPHRIVEEFFPNRREPSSFSRIPVKEASPISFILEENPEFWSDAGRVVEATLMALSRLKSHVVVETNKEGNVVGVDRGSVDAIMAEMVHRPRVFLEEADTPQGIRTYASARTRVEFTPRVPRACGIIFLEEWVPELVIFDTGA